MHPSVSPGFTSLNLPEVSSSRSADSGSNAPPAATSGSGSSPAGIAGPQTMQSKIRAAYAARRIDNASAANEQTSLPAQLRELLASWKSDYVMLSPLFGVQEGSAAAEKDALKSLALPDALNRTLSHLDEARPPQTVPKKKKDAITSKRGTVLEQTKGILDIAASVKEALVSYRQLEKEGAITPLMKNTVSAAIERKLNEIARLADQLIEHSAAAIALPACSQTQRYLEAIAVGLAQAIQAHADVHAELASVEPPINEIFAGKVADFEDAKEKSSNSDMARLGSELQEIVAQIPEKIPYAWESFAAKYAELQLYDHADLQQCGRPLLNRRLPGTLTERSKGKMIDLVYFCVVELGNIGALDNKPVYADGPEGWNARSTSTQYMSAEEKRDALALAEQSSVNVARDYGDLPWVSRFMSEEKHIRDVCGLNTNSLLDIISDDYHGETHLVGEDGKSGLYEKVMRMADKLDAVANAWGDLQFSLADRFDDDVPTEEAESMSQHLELLRSETEYQKFFAGTFASLARMYATYCFPAPAVSVAEESPLDAPADTRPAGLQGAGLQINIAEMDSDDEPGSEGDAAASGQSEHAVASAGSRTAAAVKDPEPLPGTARVAVSEKTQEIRQVREDALSAWDTAREFETAARRHMGKHNLAMTYLTKTDDVSHAILSYRKTVDECDAAIAIMKKAGIHHAGTTDRNEIMQKRDAAYRRAELLEAYLRSPKSKRQTQQTLKSIDAQGGLVVGKPDDDEFVRDVGGGKRTDHVLECRIRFTPVASSSTTGELTLNDQYFVHVHLADHVNISDPGALKNLRAEDIKAATLKTVKLRHKGRKHDRANADNRVPRSPLPDKDFVAGLARRAANSQGSVAAM